MASRRLLKKSIKNICSELFTDCVFLHLSAKKEPSEVDALMKETLALNTEFVARINHPGKKSKRLFYKKLRTEFIEQACRLSESISKA